jgi:hypothetical protein
MAYIKVLVAKSLAHDNCLRGEGKWLWDGMHAGCDEIL